MKRAYKKWFNALVKRIVKERGVSVEYADAVAIGKRNYYPMPVDQVPIR